ncbi:MAG: Hsp20/alpha crystallin family protein [Sphaerochaetaceae bacterium]|nr:Hsp20/alpha crystallin family protein [Sphaerochaetaceae bacterium]
MKYMIQKSNDQLADDMLCAFLGKWDSMPSIDVMENDGDYTLEAEMPGVSDSEVNVNIENHVLTIKSNTEKNDDKHYLYKERTTAQYERQFHLPEDVDETSITASMKNGLLTISMPKKPETQMREVSIGSN